MRTVLLLKQADCVMQLAALAIPLACCLHTPGAILAAYFTVGGVQLISLIINRLFLDKFLRHSSRSATEIITLVLVVLFPIVTIPSTQLTYTLLTCYFVILLVGSPLLAIWYWLISHNETRRISVLVDRRQYV